MTNQVNQEFEKWLLNNMWQVEHPNGDCETVLSNDDVREYFKSSESEINSLKQRIAEVESRALEESNRYVEYCNRYVEYCNLAEAKITELTTSNNRLREAMDMFVKDCKGEIIHSTNWLKQQGGKALSSTPAQSLAEHDNEVIEKCANEFNIDSNEYKTIQALKASHD